MISGIKEENTPKDDEPKSGRFPWKGDLSEEARKRRRKSEKHAKRAKQIERWTPVVGSALSLCAESAAVTTAMVEFQCAAQIMTGRKPNLLETVVSAIGAMGVGLVTGMLVDHAVEICGNAFYNNEITMAQTGTDFFEIFMLLGKDPSKLTPVDREKLMAFEAIDGDLYKDDEW